MTRRHATLGALTASALAALCLTACASPDDAPSRAAVEGVRPAAVTTPPSSAAPTATTTSGPKRCEDGQDTLSFRPSGPPPPPGAMPTGSYMATIRNHGFLKVGVDETTLFFSARNPDTGELEGFEDDLARAIAGAIFGGPSKIKFVTVTTEQKFGVVTNDDPATNVDMTISVASMECKRWNAGYDFSSPYYQAFQQIVVPEGSSINGQADLGGKRVCVTSPSSSKDLLDGLNAHATGNKINIVPVPTRPRCLIKLQNGKVDAIVLPSSIQAGILAQDPTLHAIATPMTDFTGKPSTNTYGVVTDPRHPELMLFVNALLERWRADGTLQAMVDDNLPPPPEMSHEIPPLRYRD
jgi:polar amino acid transport system substrate-binding protein